MMVHSHQMLSIVIAAILLLIASGGFAVANDMTLQDSARYDGGNDDIAFDIELGSNSKVYVGGQTYFDCDMDGQIVPMSRYLLLRLDADLGNLTETEFPNQCIARRFENQPEAMAIWGSSTFMTGQALFESDFKQATSVRFDPALDTVWVKEYPRDEYPSITHSAKGFDVDVDQDGNCYVAADEQFGLSSRSAILISYDSDGDSRWADTITGSSGIVRAFRQLAYGDDDKLYAMQQYTSDYVNYAKLYCYEPTNGDLEWSAHGYAIGNGIDVINLAYVPAYMGVSGNQRIILLAEDRFASFEPEENDPSWSNIGEYEAVAVPFGGGYAVLAGADGVVMVDAVSGNTAWEYDNGYHYHDISTTDDGGLIAVGEYGGNFVMTHFPAGFNDEETPETMVLDASGIDRAVAVTTTGSKPSIAYVLGDSRSGNSDLLIAKLSIASDLTFCTEGDTTYYAGDANNDSNTNVSDAVYITNYVFAGGPAPIPYGAGDANGDCKVNISDAVYIINYVFIGGDDPVCQCANDPSRRGI